MGDVISISAKDSVVNELQDEINDAIERCANNRHITLASIIGVLEIIKYDLITDIRESQ